ncbi:MAG: hypothetical protein AVDCRST_MAG76-3761 [uncultured Acidimicrobiales bacterium]|uniref:Peptidase S8/S53 domain-containing protein n=1 Tax=uncultured Acidimicrobiales bacterium TaxID=310071 RepID=A0A6J4JIW9_9ACTN|nr:MAG: hypothetical protein AVDCRST_MAG76-3761 [uncultured Acidimicrobiales bacterium]
MTSVERQATYGPRRTTTPTSASCAPARRGPAPAAPNAGDGIKVAIIDSGIDPTHPSFDDTGYAPRPQLGDARLTNNKVIAAKVITTRSTRTGGTVAGCGPREATSEAETELSVV